MVIIVLKTVLQMIVTFCVVNGLNIDYSGCFNFILNIFIKTNLIFALKIIYFLFKIILIFFFSIIYFL